MILFFQLPVITARLCLAEFAFDGGCEPAKFILENEIAGPIAHQFDGVLFSNLARNNQEWDVKPRFLQDFEGGRSAEMRHGIVGQDNFPLVRSRWTVAKGLLTVRFAGHWSRTAGSCLHSIM